MDVSLRQQVDLRYYFDARLALWPHSESRAERLQPVVGGIFILACVIWMSFRYPQGIGALVVSFILFWGFFLIVRRPLLRFFWLGRMTLSVRGFVYEESLRFFDEGYSRSDPVGTDRIEWGKVKGAVMCSKGIILLSFDDKGFFISCRATPRDSFEVLRTFLAEKYPDFEHLPISS